MASVWQFTWRDYPTNTSHRRYVILSDANRRAMMIQVLDDIKNEQAKDYSYELLLDDGDTVDYETAVRNENYLLGDHGHAAIFHRVGASELVSVSRERFDTIPEFAAVDYYVLKQDAMKDCWLFDMRDIIVEAVKEFERVYGVDAQFIQNFCTGRDLTIPGNPMGAKTLADKIYTLLHLNCVLRIVMVSVMDSDYLSMFRFIRCYLEQRKPSKYTNVKTDIVNALKREFIDKNSFKFISFCHFDSWNAANTSDIKPHFSAYNDPRIDDDRTLIRACKYFGVTNVVDPHTISYSDIVQAAKKHRLKFVFTQDVCSGLFKNQGLVHFSKDDPEAELVDQAQRMFKDHDGVFSYVQLNHMREEMQVEGEYSPAYFGTLIIDGRHKAECYERVESSYGDTVYGYSVRPGCDCMENNTKYQRMVCGILHGVEFNVVHLSMFTSPSWYIHFHRLELKSRNIINPYDPADVTLQRFLSYKNAAVRDFEKNTAIDPPVTSTNFTMRNTGKTFGSYRQVKRGVDYLKRRKESIKDCKLVSPIAYLPGGPNMFSIPTVTNEDLTRVISKVNDLSKENGRFYIVIGDDGRKFDDIGGIPNRMNYLLYMLYDKIGDSYHVRPMVTSDLGGRMFRRKVKHLKNQQIQLESSIDMEDVNVLTVNCNSLRIFPRATNGEVSTNSCDIWITTDNLVDLQIAAQMFESDPDKDSYVSLTYEKSKGYALSKFPNSFRERLFKNSPLPVITDVGMIDSIRAFNRILCRSKGMNKMASIITAPHSRFQAITRYRYQPIQAIGCDFEKVGDEEFIEIDCVKQYLSAFTGKAQFDQVKWFRHNYDPEDPDDDEYVKQEPVDVMGTGYKVFRFLNPSFEFYDEEYDYPSLELMQGIYYGVFDYDKMCELFDIPRYHILHRLKRIQRFETTYNMLFTIAKILWNLHLPGRDPLSNVMQTELELFVKHCILVNTKIFNLIGGYFLYPGEVRKHMIQGLKSKRYRVSELMRYLRRYMKDFSAHYCDNSTLYETDPEKEHPKESFETYFKKTVELLSSASSKYLSNEDQVKFIKRVVNRSIGCLASKTSQMKSSNSVMYIPAGQTTSKGLSFVNGCSLLTLINPDFELDDDNDDDDGGGGYNSIPFIANMNKAKIMLNHRVMFKRSDRTTDFLRFQLIDIANCSFFAFFSKEVFVRCNMGYYMDGAFMRKEDYEENKIQVAMAGVSVAVDPLTGVVRIPDVMNPTNILDGVGQFAIRRRYCTVNQGSIISQSEDVFPALRHMYSQPQPYVFDVNLVIEDAKKDAYDFGKQEFTVIDEREYIIRAVITPNGEKIRDDLLKQELEFGRAEFHLLHSIETVRKGVGVYAYTYLKETFYRFSEHLLNSIEKAKRIGNIEIEILYNDILSVGEVAADKVFFETGRLLDCGPPGTGKTYNTLRRVKEYKLRNRGAKIHEISEYNAQRVGDSQTATVHEIRYGDLPGSDNGDIDAFNRRKRQTNIDLLVLHEYQSLTVEHMISIHNQVSNFPNVHVLANMDPCQLSAIGSPRLPLYSDSNVHTFKTLFRRYVNRRSTEPKRLKAIDDLATYGTEVGVEYSIERTLSETCKDGNLMTNNPEYVTPFIENNVDHMVKIYKKYRNKIKSLRDVRSVKPIYDHLQPGEIYYQFQSYTNACVGLICALHSKLFFNKLRQLSTSNSTPEVFMTLGISMSDYGYGSCNGLVNPYVPGMFYMVKNNPYVLNVDTKRKTRLYKNESLLYCGRIGENYYFRRKVAGMSETSMLMLKQIECVVSLVLGVACTFQSSMGATFESGTVIMDEGIVRTVKRTINMLPIQRFSLGIQNLMVACSRVRGNKYQEFICMDGTLNTDNRMCKLVNHNWFDCVSTYGAHADKNRLYRRSSVFNIMKNRQWTIMKRNDDKYIMDRVSMVSKSLYKIFTNKTIDIDQKEICRRIHVIIRHIHDTEKSKELWEALKKFSFGQFKRVERDNNPVIDDDE